VKVLLLSRYGSLGASSRVRSYQYIPYLKTHGIDVIVSSLLGDQYLQQIYSGEVNHFRERIGSYFYRVIELHKIRKYDLLWIEKELFPWLPAWCEMLLARLNIPYIVDFDDAVFHNYNSHSNIFVRKYLVNKIETVMRNSTMVIAGNEYLMNHAKGSGARRVEYLPSVVDLEKYHVKERTISSFFTIGWIGSPTTTKYLEILRSIFSEWDKINKVQLVIIGSDSFKLDGIVLKHHPWSLDSEVADIQQFDVGIMPLLNMPWERGKCGYKLIQYMACGKPVIASPVGVNSKIVEHGVGGFLANSVQEWIKALDILYLNHETRIQMGQFNRNKVEKEYSLQKTAPQLMALLKSI
jgi:glycosyltransferase involved in cell wall biosynthesis